MHPSRDSLQDYALGRSGDGDFEQIASHLEQCDRCRELVEQTPGDRFVGLLRTVDPHESAETPLRVHRGYELVEQIGRGGMGIVYRAVQRDLDRVVALKRLKSEDAMDPDSLVRFRVEANAMARLQHPNILQVFDVGEQDGQPYIACEYVPGGGLDRQLTGKPLPYRAACRLLITLARAVHAAHEQSVIHRDLKPSNVLLAWDANLPAQPDDEDFWRRVTPKISDFGLAKELDQGKGRTFTGALLGTPDYMSPEQASGGSVGPATDVWALGVILYECLTGHRPFQGSTVVETLDLVRSSDPAHLSRRIPNLAHDLSVICLMCLNKNQSRRYPTAAALADDLERFLAGKPIQARRVSHFERLVKWARRRPVAATGAVVGVLALCGFIVGILWHNQRLQAEVERANDSEAFALRNFRNGYDTLERLMTDFALARADTEAWSELDAALKERALKFCYDAIDEADESKPEIRLARATALLYAGSTHETLHRPERALEDLEPARQILESLLKQSPADAEIRERLSMCYFWSAVARHERGDNRQAEEFARKSIERMSELMGSTSKETRIEKRLARQKQFLGDLLRFNRRGDEARPLYEEVLAMRHRVAEVEPLDVENRLRFTLTSLDLCAIAMAEQHWDAAEQCLQEAERFLHPTPDAPQPFELIRTEAELHRIWGAMLYVRGQTDRSLIRTSYGIEVLEKLLEREPTDAAGRVTMHGLWRNKAWVLSREGKTDEAPAAWDRAVEFADGDEKTFCRIERALERALAGDHATATTEVNALVEEKLSPLNRIHLVRVYSRSIEAVGNDPTLDEDRRAKLAVTFASHGAEELAKLDTYLRKNAERLNEVDSDPALFALRQSDPFQAWRTQLNEQGQN